LFIFISNLARYIHNDLAAAAICRERTNRFRHFLEMATEFTILNGKTDIFKMLFLLQPVALEKLPAVCEPAAALYGRLSFRNALFAKNPGNED
jgi:hypothetical protein